MRRKRPVYEFARHPGSCAARIGSIRTNPFYPGTDRGQAAQILGVAHIALYAHDLEASRAFYRDFLGFQEPFSLKNDDGSIRTDFFKINDRQYIELSAERAPGTDRLNHIAIETDDAEAMRVYLASRGIEVPFLRAEGPHRQSKFHDQRPRRPRRGDRPIPSG